MMRCLLHSSGLGPEYLTYALRMAVYIKNRLQFKSLQLTPFQSFTGKKPDLSRLRIFGSRVRTRRPGRRPAKLDTHSDNGIFLSFGATDANAYFIDDASSYIRSAGYFAGLRSHTCLFYVFLMLLERTLNGGTRQIE